jgi:hypothetical protein
LQIINPGFFFGKNGNIMERYLVLTDADVTNTDSVAKAVKKMGLTVEDVYPFINTLVVSGSKKKILTLPKKIEGITSIEEEGEVKAIE